MRAGTYGFVRRVYGRAFGLERYFRKSWNCKLTHLHFTERNFWTIATGRESFNFLKIVKKASIVLRLFDCHFHNSCVTILDHACVCTVVLVRISSCRFGRVVYLQNLQSHVFCEFSLFFCLAKEENPINEINTASGVKIAGIKVEWIAAQHYAKPQPKKAASDCFWGSECVMVWCLSHILVSF